MNSTDAEGKPPIPTWKWGVIVLMLLATVINYLDRSALASVSSHIMRDFDLKEKGYGTLELWFGISYAIFLLIAGILADHWSLRWLYAGALLVWSAAGFATGYVGFLIELQICRAVLGAGEAFNWPVAVGVVRRVIPRESRALANGVFNSGMTIGAVLTPVLVLLMVNNNTGEGWRSLFKVVGAAGSLWVILWLLFTRRERTREMTPRPSALNSGTKIICVLLLLLLLDILRNPELGRPLLFKVVGATVLSWVVHGFFSARAARAAREMAPRPEETAGPPSVPFTAVFALRTFWITMAVGIAVNIAWHLYRVWLPRHFVRDLKFTDKELQYLQMGYFLTADLGSILFGYITKRITSSGLPVERARKRIVLISSCVCLLSLPALLTPGRWVMVPLYCIVGAGIMGVFAMFYSFVQDIVPEHTSKCLGLIGSTVWFITAFLHPMIGEYADTHDTFIGRLAPILLVASALPLFAALFALTWPEKREAAQAS